MKNETGADGDLPEMSLPNVSRRGFLCGSATAVSAAIVGAASPMMGQPVVAQAASTMPPPAPDASGGMGVRRTYPGGPTYLIEIGNFRIIPDPGFGPQGTERDEGPGRQASIHLRHGGIRAVVRNSKFKLRHHPELRSGPAWPASPPIAKRP